MLVLDDSLLGEGDRLHMCPIGVSTVILDVRKLVNLLTTAFGSFGSHILYGQLCIRNCLVTWAEFETPLIIF